MQLGWNQQFKNGLIIGGAALGLLLAALPAAATEVSASSGAYTIKVMRSGQSGAVESLVLVPAKKMGFKEYVLKTLMQFENLKATQTQRDQELLYSNLKTSLEPKKQKELVATSLKKFHETDFQKERQSLVFRKVVDAMSVKLAQNYLVANTLADLNTHNYFYSAQWRKNLISWSLDLAQQFGGTSPGINLALYLFQKSIDDLIARRSFFQNYLQYMMSHGFNYGLTAAEQNLALSSLYEAKIAWYQFSTSEQAGKTWPMFGQASMGADANSCRARLESHSGDYTSTGAGIDFVFYAATSKNGDSVIINTRDASSRLESSPSLAFNLSDASQLAHLRHLYEIFLLGLNLAPVPGPLQALVTYYVQSEYIPQVQSEGGLYAHFLLGEGSGNADQVLAQSVNAYIQNMK